MKAVALLSNGLDSPVAAYLLACQGAEITGLFFPGEPYSDEGALGRYGQLVDIISKAAATPVKAAYVPGFGEMKKEMGERGEVKYRCVLCKRTMYKVAEKLAHELGATGIITGESLGQVASQTLTNMQVLDDSVSIPVIRPLIGLDKEDTIRVAREIGTYDVSTAKGVSCGLAPRHPATAAAIEKVQELEERVGVEQMVEQCLDNVAYLNR